MTRLTSWMRQTAVKALSAELGKEIKRAEGKLQDAAASIFLRSLSKHDRDILKSIPGEWFSYNSRIEFNIGGQRHSATSEKVPFVPASVKGTWENPIILAPTSRDGERIMRLSSDILDLRGRLRVITQEAEGVLSRATTVKKAVEIWPDAAKYLPKEDKPKPVPAIPVEHLTDKIKAWPKAA